MTLSWAPSDCKDCLRMSTRLRGLGFLYEGVYNQGSFRALQKNNGSMNSFGVGGAPLLEDSSHL